MSKWIISVDPQKFYVINKHVGSSYIVYKDPTTPYNAFIKQVRTSYPKKVYTLVKERLRREYGKVYK